MDANQFSTQSQAIYNQAKCVTIPFTWAIDHFSKRAEAKLENVLRASGHPLEWKLNLSLGGRTYATKDFINIAISLLSHTKDSVDAQWNVWVALDKQNCEACKVSFHSYPARTYRKSDSQKPIKFNNFVLLSTLKQPFPCPHSTCGRNLPLLSDDTLTIKGEITAIVGDEMINDRYEIQQFQAATPTLAQELGMLLQNKLFGDITLVVDEHVLRAHKNILAARSSVFAAMFSNEMKEYRQNSVTITDASYEVISEMLHFIYTDSAPNLKTLAMELLIVADKYAIPKLKLLCEKMIFSALSEATAAGVLMFADMHNAAQLKKFTLNYIQCHAAAVMDTKDWNFLVEKHPKLVTEALKKMLK